MGEFRSLKIRDIINLEYGKGLKDYRSGFGKFDVFGTNGKIGLADVYLFEKPSVIIGRKGAYREVHLAINPSFVIDTAFYTTNKISELDTLYLFYWFKNVDINQMDSGSAIPSTSRDEVYDLDILLPTFPEQKAIATVLSSLDDKIDLLRRQNKTLEAMAETLFRQWFVEEDKVGWKEYKISDIAIHNTAIVKPQSNSRILYNHYSLPAFDAGKKVVSEFGLKILSNKYEVVENSILVSKLNPRIPRIWAILDNLPENSICSTEFQVFTSKHQDMLGFLYFLFKSDVAIAELEMAASGTSGSHQRVTPKDMLNVRFSLPNKEKAISFSKISQHFLNKIDQNYSQIHTLEKLRDNLLPKLMSGEARVTYE